MYLKPLHWPWLTLSTLLICITLALLAPFGSDSFFSLTLKQAAPFEPLRWLSGNLIHTDNNHLGWNLTALGMLGILIERYSRLLWLLTMVIGFVVIDGYFFLQSQFQQYAGLSGVLNGYLVVCLYCLRNPAQVIKGNEILWFVLLLTTFKNGYEMLNGIALFSNTRWPGTPGFHLVGMGAGVMTVVVWHCFFHLRHAGSARKNQ